MVALIAVLACAPPAAAGAGGKVVEAETLTGDGVVVVRDAGAAGGRALLLRPGVTASRRVRTGGVGAVSLRLRGSRCLRARAQSLHVQIDGGKPAAVAVARQWSRRRVVVDVAPGRHVVRLSVPRDARGGRRCGARVDRIHMRAAARDTVPEPPAPPSPPARPALRRPLGTAVQLRHLRADAGYVAALTSGTFSSFSPENELKMEWTQPRRGEWNFGAADALVGFAAANGLDVRGHTLVFGAQTPPWVGRLLFAREVDQALQDQVRTTILRYKDRIREWDVVNEAFDARGRYRSNAFYDRLGPTYVDRAFMAARQADPTAKLFYNEYDADVANPKREAVIRLVRRLKDQGLIDGVGLQLHTQIGHQPTLEALLDTMRSYEAMGLEVQITEMDVSAIGDGTPESLSARLAEQADVYRTAATACAQVAACTRMTVWGVADRFSWLEPGHIPLLLDDAFQPKPALTAVQQALSPSP